MAVSLMVISVWRVRQLEALAEGEAVGVAEAEAEALAEALVLGIAVLAGTAGEAAVLLLAF
jgi:hypothetical protein